LKQRVFDLSISAWQSFSSDMPTLAEAWIDTVKRTGSKLAIADTLGSSLSASRALTAAIVFSRLITKLSSEQNIGLLLPTSSGGVIANMAALLAGKTIVNINYTASVEALSSSLQQAKIKTIYTSKRFLTKLAKRGIDLAAQFSDVNIVYLEELKDDIGKVEMLTTLLMVKLLPSWCLKSLLCQQRDARQIAAILFSSGSEGLPKGIELSHQNIMANLKQVAEVVNAESNDVVMASLPLFHAFGLTVTQFMPLIEGLPMVCHADPTDGLGVAKAIAQYRASIMCGTSTFLRLYTRDSKVKALMLESLRIVVSGAEKLNPDVRDGFKLKFGKDVYEGYGATETSPVASVNLPDKMDSALWKIQSGSKQGSVGMPLPGTSFKIVDPNSFEELPRGEDGMILIGGPQVMQGYLNEPTKTQQAIRVMDGIRWYVSGDKGHLDKDGFLVIIDRYSRFAKIGGEMISLSEVEAMVKKSLALTDVEVVAVNIPDEKKGEKVVLLSEQDLDLLELKKSMLAAGSNPLLIPAKLLQVRELPKLGSGKTDFSKAKLLAG
jgi:acyl-[acyl-carrier-protein]-phospholipid O-acyltransferase/long-chain-fatty-acid--[acyl-carrier-protein] ligase